MVQGERFYYEIGEYQRWAVPGPSCGYWTVSIRTNFEICEHFVLALTRFVRDSLGSNLTRKLVIFYNVSVQNSSRERHSWRVHVGKHAGAEARRASRVAQRAEGEKGAERILTICFH